MKPRDLLPLIASVRRQTTSRDMLTICDELHDRVVKQMADSAGPADLDAAASKLSANMERSQGKKPNPRRGKK